MLPINWKGSPLGGGVIGFTEENALAQTDNEPGHLARLLIKAWRWGGWAREECI
jgi:hypothetical protein